MCWEESSRGLWALGALVALVITLAVPVWLIVRAKGDRRVVLGTWAAVLPLAPALVWINSALGEPVLGEVAFAAGCALGLLLGVIVGAVHKRRRPTLALIGALGSAGLVASAAALFVGLLAATGTCLD